jgi:nitroreductase
MTNNFPNFLLKRRSVTAKKMSPTIVNDEDLNSIISAGIRVPDHGALTPWRIVIFKDEGREKFGKSFLGKRFKITTPNATEEEIAYEENRFLRAGVVICVISSPVEHKKIPVWEMQLSSAAVCQNMLIGAQSLGYAAQWLTEWYTYDEVILKELGVSQKDKISGFIYIGKKMKSLKIESDLKKKKLFLTGIETRTFF